MTISTETHTALAALSSRILSAPSVFPQEHPLNDIFRDLSWLERRTLEHIVKTKRAGSGLVLNENNITELTLLQQRIFNKHQTDPFVATELKALANCTGIERPEIATGNEKGGSTPFPRTVLKRRTVSDPERQLYVASWDYGTVRCNQIRQLAPRSECDNADGELAPV